MWPLSNRTEFCNTSGEWHAICCGVGDGLRPWCSQKASECLHANEWHYYTVARGITTTLWIAGLLLLARKR